MPLLPRRAGPPQTSPQFQGSLISQLYLGQAVSLPEVVVVVEVVVEGVAEVSVGKRTMTVELLGRPSTSGVTEMCEKCGTRCFRASRG
jgi:hypothetical protein